MISFCPKLQKRDLETVLSNEHLFILDSLVYSATEFGFIPNVTYSDVLMFSMLTNSECSDELMFSKYMTERFFQVNMEKK